MRRFFTIFQKLLLVVCTKRNDLSDINLVYNDTDVDSFYMSFMKHILPASYKHDQIRFGIGNVKYSLPLELPTDYQWSEPTKNEFSSFHSEDAKLLITESVSYDHNYRCPCNLLIYRQTSIKKNFYIGEAVKFNGKQFNEHNTDIFINPQFQAKAIDLHNSYEPLNFISYAKAPESKTIFDKMLKPCYFLYNPFGNSTLPETFYFKPILLDISVNRELIRYHSATVIPSRFKSSQDFLFPIRTSSGYCDGVFFRSQ